MSVISLQSQIVHDHVGNSAAVLKAKGLNAAVPFFAVLKRTQAKASEEARIVVFPFAPQSNLE